MFQRTAALAALAAGILALASATGLAQPNKKAKPEDAVKVKKALQEVQDFVGTWNLEGTQKVGSKTDAWKEKVAWGWKFKDGDAWITVEFAEGKGKYFSGGELRYNLDKKKYVLALTPSGKGEAQTFEGDFAKGALKVDRKDAKTGDVYRVTMNTAAEGARFAMKYEKQDGGKGLFAAVHQMSGSKDGESFAGGAKKPECIVSGGSANIPVTYMGKTYYVCCSGCRDEFNADPAKYVKGK
ncbi:YHS domain-containing protein [Gemmata sp. JC673]|uniref:YHS domain-containing protein n=1 Tax=Gemmata algarum TaxID=2975278 RepID=A0ABU5FCZ5_9BACT|nr:YHS domain-containing protein [Gemmata algarum]MDY3563669.1 YHS domain-containing protein [Gemmata algarum]